MAPSRIHVARTEVWLQASPARVYDVLVDFARWPEWNPSVCSLRGRPEVGARLTLGLEVAPGRTLKVRPVITRLGPEFGLEWRGGAPGMPWLLDVHHAFQISPAASELGEQGPAGATRFVHEERFSGALAAPIWRLLERRLMPRYRATNEGLRRAVAGD